MFSLKESLVKKNMKVVLKAPDLKRARLHFHFYASSFLISKFI